MPSTAKDSLFESTTSEGAAKGEAQIPQPSDATGAEIPVTIHASRYSAAAKGAGKLPPVHEDTRTVIIFPQGAVVRLSAMVTPGELVVLTNNRTGADVICRVTTVKTQPGIQNYVNLEFTQRAVGFWEEPRQAERAAKNKAPLGVVSPATPPHEPTPITAVHKAPIPTAQMESPVSPSASSAEVKSISPQPLRVSSLADTQATKSREDVAEIPVAPPQISEIASTSAISGKQPRVIPSRIPRFESFDAPNLQQNKGSKKIVLIVTAAIVLLAIGAVGGALFLRWNRVLETAQQPLTAAISTPTSEPAAAIPAPVPLAPEAAPIANASGKSSSVAPASIPTLPNNAAPVASTAPQSMPARLTIDTPKVEVRSEPQPQPVTRPNISVGKIHAPTVKTAAKINPVEPPPLLSSATTLPRGLNESVMNTAVPNSLAVPAQPVPLAPTKGGQLQQPKLISSVASVYPAAAKAAHAQGDVTLDALIDATGKVVAAKVISGSPLLQQAALDSLRLWKYEPARLDGQPIPIHIKVNISFRLQ